MSFLGVMSFELPASPFASLFGLMYTEFAQILILKEDNPARRCYLRLDDQCQWEQLAVATGHTFAARHAGRISGRFAMLQCSHDHPGEMSSVGVRTADPEFRILVRGDFESESLLKNLANGAQ